MSIEKTEKSMLTKSNIDNIEKFSKEMKVSVSDALNTFVKKVSEEILTQETDKINNIFPESKNKKSKILSIIIFTTSIFGIFLGVVYVLYIKQ